MKHYFWVCLRVFLAEMSIWIGKLSKEGPHWCGWVLFNPLRGPIGQKEQGRGQLALSELRHPHSLALRYQRSWFPGLWAPPASLGLQLADVRRIAGLLSLHNHVSQVLIIDFCFVCISINVFCVFGKPWLIRSLWGSVWQKFRNHNLDHVCEG